ncbi:MAG: hypothetical protein H6732_07340 [Alphaproteobacteria bacterium]|nr:hypothetical protein [Alphaproteobacteria bacterium]
MQRGRGSFTSQGDGLGDDAPTRTGLTQHLQALALVLGPLLLLGLHAVGPWGPTPRGPGGPDPRVFGIDATRWLGGWRWAWLGAAAMVVLWPTARRAVGEVVVAASERLSARRSIAGEVALAAGALVVLLGNASTTLYGDGHSLLVRVTQRVPPVTSQVLDLAAHDALYDLLVRLGVVRAPWWSYALWSAVAGLVYLGAVRRFGREGPGDAASRAQVVVALLTAGTVQLFFGYVESYSLVTAVLTAVAAHLLLPSEGARAPLLVGLGTGLAVAFHLLALAALPAVAWWLARTARSRPLPTLGGVVAGLVGPALAVGVMQLVHSQPVDRMLRASHPGGANRQMLLPPWPAKPGDASLLSEAHLADTLNLVVLLAPVALPALLVALTRRRPTPGDPVAWLLAAGFGALLLLWEPDMGAAKDWDLFAAAGPPLALLAAGATAARLSAAERVETVGSWAVVGAAVTLPWVLGNALGLPC